MVFTSPSGNCTIFFISVKVRDSVKHLFYQYNTGNHMQRFKNTKVRGVSKLKRDSYKKENKELFALSRCLNSFILPKSIHL